MAKTITKIRDRENRDREAYVDNITDGEIDRRVSDSTAHGKLDQIIAGVGGGTDTTATIYNVTMTSADTEQSQALPANTKEVVIRVRGNSTLKLAFSSGQSGTTYLTVRPGATFHNSEYFVSQTLYF